MLPDLLANIYGLSSGSEDVEDVSVFFLFFNHYGSNRMFSYISNS